MKSINRIVDALQATFPPNRVVLLLGGLITALSSTISAWIAAHFPGLNLGAPEIAGVLAAAALITMRLFDRWLNQWQKGEPIHVERDLDTAINALVDDPEVQHALEAAGTLEAVHTSLEHLRLMLEQEKSDGNMVAPDPIAAQLAAIGDEISGFLHGHPPEDAAAPQ